MQKLKSLNLSWFLSVLKCCLIGLVVTLIGVILLAFLMKFIDFSSGIVNYLNNIVKAIALFVVSICLKKSSGDKLLIKLVLAGAIYAILTFVVFSILNGKFIFDASLIFNMLFCVIVALIAGIILNLFRKNA